MQSEKILKNLQRQLEKYQRKLYQCEKELKELKKSRRMILQRISILKNNSINDGANVSIFKKIRNDLVKQDLVAAKYDLQECDEEINMFQRTVDEIKEKIDSIADQICKPELTIRRIK